MKVGDGQPCPGGWGGEMMGGLWGGGEEGTEGRVARGQFSVLTASPPSSSELLRAAVWASVLQDANLHLGGWSSWCSVSSC